MSSPPIAVPDSMRYRLIFESLIQQGFCRCLLYLIWGRTAVCQRYQLNELSMLVLNEYEAEYINLAEAIGVRDFHGMNYAHFHKELVSD